MTGTRKSTVVITMLCCLWAVSIDLYAFQTLLEIPLPDSASIKVTTSSSPLDSTNPATATLNNLKETVPDSQITRSSIYTRQMELRKSWGLTTDTVLMRTLEEYFQDDSLVNQILFHHYSGIRQQNTPAISNLLILSMKADSLSKLFERRSSPILFDHISINNPHDYKSQALFKELMKSQRAKVSDYPKTQSYPETSNTPQPGNKSLAWILLLGLGTYLIFRIPRSFITRIKGVSAEGVSIITSTVSTWWMPLVWGQFFKKEVKKTNTEGAFLKEFIHPNFREEGLGDLLELHATMKAQNQPQWWVFMRLTTEVLGLLWCSAKKWISDLASSAIKKKQSKV